MEIESGEKRMVVPTDYIYIYTYIYIYIYFVIDSVPGIDPHTVWRVFLFESTSK